MNRVRFSEFALDDLKDIAEYLTEENDGLAKQVIMSIRGFCHVLKFMPELGRLSEIVGVRKLIVPHFHYKIIYEIRAGRKEIVILRVCHDTRKMPY